MKKETKATFKDKAKEIVEDILEIMSSLRSSSFVDISMSLEIYIEKQLKKAYNKGSLIKMSEIKITKNEEGYWLDYDDKFDGPFETVEEAEHEKDAIEIWDKVGNKRNKDIMNKKEYKKTVDLKKNNY